MDSSIATKRDTKCRKGLKSLDRFGVPISLKYYGANTYKTPCGGFVTLITYFSVLIFVFVDLN